MAPKTGQLIARGERAWLVGVSLGRDPETGTRKYHNKTTRGSLREAQRYLNNRRQERDIGKLPTAAAIQPNPYLDQWPTTSAKPSLRAKSYSNYEALPRSVESTGRSPLFSFPPMSRRDIVVLYVRPVLGNPFTVEEFREDDLLWRVELWRVEWIGGVGQSTRASSTPKIDVCSAQFPLARRIRSTSRSTRTPCRALSCSPSCSRHRRRNARRSSRS
jgi:hypothetical protein